MTDSVVASAATAVHREGYTYGGVLECEATDTAEDAETIDTAVDTVGNHVTSDFCLIL